MSKFTVLMGLVLGSICLAAGSAQANDQWYGPYNSYPEARADGDYEIDNNGAESYSINNYSEDPSGMGGGAGHYLLVKYPDQPSQVNSNGILGVPLPGLQPGGLGADESDSGEDDDGMDP